MLFLLACIDNRLVDKDSVAPAFDTSGDSGVDTVGGDTEAPPEECNGVDDDGDGAIDEDFPDDDGNGRPDCLDTTCAPLTLPPAEDVPVSEVCEGTDEPVDDPWNVVEEWTWSGSAQGVVVLPVVGNLTDDNGDGATDGDDVPDIAYGEYFANEVGLLRSDGSGPIWTVPDMDPLAQPVIADLDGDGLNEVVFFDSTHLAHAYSGDGTERWVATEAETLSYVVPTVCDLDGDGLAELISGNNVLNGEDGTLAFQLGTDTFTTFPICEDLDVDGTPEIVLGRTIFDATGAEILSLGVVDYEALAAPIQADGDDAAELVLLGDTSGALYDDDGSTLVSFSTSGNLTGAPCVADFDGDGASEFAIPSNTTLTVLETDGTVLWSLVTGDTSGFAGCSAWDVDRDGAMELLMAGESKFRIFDGATGAEHFVGTQHNSVTLFEYPVIADVDHDGSAEILVIDNANTGGAPRYGITAYGHAGGAWPVSGPTWGIHGYAETNQDDDGGVPASPPTPWLDPGVYRGRTSSAGGLARPDLRASVVDACIADCTWGPVAVSVAVENVGGADVDAGAILTLYAVDNAGERAVWSTTLPAIAAGRSLDAMQADVPIADRGDGRWRVAVDEGRLVEECDEGNNSGTWNDTVCL